MGDVMKKTYLLIVIVLLISLVVGVGLYKVPIEDVEICEIQAIDGIGEALSLRIVNYIGDSEKFDIDDLESISGIGPERMKLLKRRFR